MKRDALALPCIEARALVERYRDDALDIAMQPWLESSLVAWDAFLMLESIALGSLP